MKAIIGRDAVLEFLGNDMCQGMLGGINREHAERDTPKKCSSKFSKLVCCRPRGHAGAHFSRGLNRDDGPDFVVTAVWSAK